MKKLLAAVMLLLAAYGLASLDWRPPRPVEAPAVYKQQKGAGALVAGAARIDMTPREHVPLAGYPRWSWDDSGTRERVSARAMWLEEPGCSVALVSAELLLVPFQLTEAVEEKLGGAKPDHLVIAATHTHAGPGAYWDNGLGERLATGPYDRKVLEFLAERIADAVKAARESKEPAKLAAVRVDAPELARNRRWLPEVDGHLVVLRLEKVAGGPIGTLVSFPSHAAILDVQNDRLSGDWPGFMMRGLEGEKLGPPTLFMQGASGDQSPRLADGKSFEGPEPYGQALAEKVPKVETGAFDEKPPLAFAAVSTLLPPPVAGGAPRLTRGVASNLLVHWLPSRGKASAVRLGPLTLLFVPAEPTAAVGERWRKRAGEGTEVVSLASDYLGYVETAERMEKREGETPRTYYGPELAARLEDALAAAALATK